jgi:hypothetical protein
MNNKNTLLNRAKELEQAVNLENKRVMLGKNKFTSMGKPLIQKGKEISVATEPETMFKRFNIAEQKEKNNRENLSLLEKGLMEGNEFIQLGKMKRKTKPVVVNETVEINFENVIPYDNRHEKLLHYAEKYRIPYSRGGVKKTLKDLAIDIHKYEMKNIKKLMKLGLDKKYKEYGHYLKLV